MNSIIKYISTVHFTYELWSAASLTEFGIKQREPIIIHYKHLLRKYAVGYCNGEKSLFRPKKNTTAVMFFINNTHFWTHLTNKEFKQCFPELKIS
jgi:hypothetical protein